MSDARQQPGPGGRSVVGMAFPAPGPVPLQVVDPPAPVAIVCPTSYAVVNSPVGPLTLTGTGDAITGCWFEGHLRPTEVSAQLERDDGAFADAADQLAAYFAGRLRHFDLPLAPRGTPFQLRVWDQLRQIPYGETRSYGRLAKALASPGASRAVGMANGRNPLSIIVPCHRVIGSDGKLTGFAGGMARKRFLLELEAGVDSLL